MSKHTKLVIVVLLVISAFLGWWFWQPEEQVEQADLFAWIQSGYTQQFCKVIFPKISSCVTPELGQCEKFADEQMLPCLATLQMNLPDFDTPEQRKAVYDSVGACYQQNIHDEIVAKYLVDSDACRQLMS